MHANTSPPQPGADGPATAPEAAPEIPPHAYAIAAAYLAAGKGPEAVHALARLFAVLPGMERDIPAAMADLSRR
jgi:hypothetical protein